MTAQAQLFPNKPSHRLYVVTGEGEDANWRDIGAAWAHKDGKGFSISTAVIPLTGRIVLRVNEPKAKTDTGARA